MTKKDRKWMMLFVCTLLLATLIGCLGNTPEINTDSPNQDGPSEKNVETEPAPEPEPTAETGAIQGQVVDDAYDPIPGAKVSISNNTGTLKETITDTDGKYTINGIPPGKYGIRFTAECCQEHLDQIRVHAERTSTSSPVLEAWGGHESYVEPREWTGFLCAKGGTAASSYCSAADENHQHIYDFQVDRGIKTLLVALDWEEGFNLKDCLYIRVHVDTGHEDYNSNWLHASEPCEEAPIEFRLDAGNWEETRYGDPEENDFANITDWMPLKYWIYAEFQADPPPNIVFQQPFTVYWEEHYWEHAPEGASALPDQ